MGNYTQYFLITYKVIRASLVAQTVKKSACNAGDLIWPLSREDPLEKWMATHFSIFAWRIPWTEEPVRLQFTGLQRVGHDFYIYKYMCLPNNYRIYSSLWPPEKKKTACLDIRHQHILNFHRLCFSHWRFQLPTPHPFSHTLGQLCHFLGVKIPSSLRLYSNLLF